MRTLEQWFSDYEVSHQNPTNKAIHYICVPAIFFSVIGMLFCVKITILNLNYPILENLAFLVLIFVLGFYFRTSISMALKMTVFSMLCLVVNYYISNYVPLFLFSISIFVLAWIGQFYGHKIEGKKPSFIDDLQFLMIGPAWVIENLFSKK
jgi:uncharacterized membrane protein YGL010W